MKMVKLWIEEWREKEKSKKKYEKSVQKIYKKITIITKATNKNKYVNRIIQRKRRVGERLEKCEKE